MEYEWLIAPIWPRREAAAIELGVSPIVAQVLHNRGIDDAESARAFLNPKLSSLAEPEEYEDISRAAETIAQAVRGGRKIVIYGDYDVDGVCGCAVLWHILSRADANLDVYIPHRVEEGYGLNLEAIDKLADDGVNLIVTVDCGICDYEVVARANERGMEVIVTDHHEPGDRLPPATAVVHPSRRTNIPSRPGTTKVNPCGAGVAFKLAWAVARELSQGKRIPEPLREDLVELTALVALATITDVASLLGENRILVKFGLEQLSRTKIVGLQALLSGSRLSGSRLDSYHVGFVLGPRLNAAGRMGHAREAFELLTVSDRAEADRLVTYLERQNRSRQKLEERITREALELAEYQGQLKEDIFIFVLAKEDWHVGVIGIVASKLVERFDRPVILIGIKGERGQGSARSVPGFDINKALSVCDEYLLGYGGHAMAAGLQIESGKIIPFMQKLQSHANKLLSGKPAFPPLKIDARVEPETIDSHLVSELRRLGPFGHGNPRPILASGTTTLVGEPRMVGNGGKHLSFSVRWGDKVFRAIAFNQAEDRDKLLDSRRCQLAFEPIADDFQGPGMVQLRVRNLKPVN